MNKQDKRPKGGRGIEWCDYTWNPVGGCQHACRWRMPDGSIAICYAEEVANGVASSAYPQGFEHHYWNEQRLQEPLQLSAPSKIFCDSMADLFGAWVPDAHKMAVLDVMHRSCWHTFQSLTKAAPNMLKYNDYLPDNLWAGASVPPTFFKGHELTQSQQERMLHRILEVLSEIKTPVRWLSIEPLSWDISDILMEWQGAIEWAVIGAASNGKRKYQPEPEWVQNTLAVLDMQNVAVFFKGNLKWSPWREEFPIVAPKQLRML